ncbi:MAG: rhodanese-like domain-containing protein [Verrucomicrobiota bacterium]
MATSVKLTERVGAGTVTVEGLARLGAFGGVEAEAGGVLIDVRTPAEYAEVHVAGSELMPLDGLDAEAVRALGGDEVYVICGTGKRAGMAMEKLAEAGVGHCVLVEGGLAAWEAAGLPVERGTRKVMSLERQVRVAAGLLVVSGVLLGWLVSLGWLLLAGFVGAGLVFAGLTDTCGMGLMLAKMPWNR